MGRLIVLIILLLVSRPAFAVCPTTQTDCMAAPTYKNLTVWGPAGVITPNVNGVGITTSPGATLTLSAGKTLTIGNSLTLTGTDGTSFVYPTISDTLAGISATQALTNKTYNGLTITPTTGSLTISNGKTLTIGNSLTLTGTDGTSFVYPTISDTLAGISATQALTNKTYNGLTITPTTGSLTISNGKTLTIGNSIGLTGTDGTSFVLPATNDTLAGLGTSQTFSGDNQVNNGIIVPGIVYPAKAFGSCIWDAAHDVGACINSAIATAAAAGGGTVSIPAGNFGVSTTITNSTSGVRLVAQGVGIPRATNSPGSYLATTKLTWIGAAGGTMLTEYAGSNLTLYNVDVTGIVFDCANLANVCAHFTNVTYSTIAIGSSEPRSVGIWFDTAGDNTTPGPGNQWNEMWLYSRSTSPSNTYSPTGILLDQGSGSNFNTSFNHIHSLSAWFAQGDGIVIASSDNNQIDTISTGANPGNDTGRPVVFASSRYTMPNGLTVNGLAYDSKAYHLAGPSMDVQGFQSGSTITAGINTGTAAINTITLTTSGTTASGNATLNFAATTNVLGGMSVNCTGGFMSGVMPNSQLVSVTGTTAVMRQGAVGAVSNGQSCTFGYGITNSAVAGTYTLTAVDGTHWSITAPAGGHSQSNIAVASGAVTFTDMVIPFTGTPNTNDTFTVVVPSPARNLTLEMLDKANSDQSPILETGANYWLTTTQAPWPTPYGGTGQFAVVAQLSFGTAPVQIGPQGSVTVTGADAAGFGGIGVNVSGFGAGSVGGHNNSASGTYSYVAGEANTTSGAESFASGESNLSDGQSTRGGGSDSTTRTRYATDCWGAGKFSAQGDAQSCVQLLKGRGSSTSAILLTADGLTAGSSNCVNLPNNTGYSLNVTIMAFDHTTVSKNATWPSWAALLTRGANAASTAIVAGTKPTPLTNGTLTGSDVVLSADTTNGCLTATFTPPTGNTDTWDVVARVTSVEVQ